MHRLLTVLTGLALAADAFAVPMLGGYPQLDDDTTAIPAEDDFAPFRITPYRAEHVNLRNATGTEIGTIDNPVYVNGTSSVLSPLTAFTARANKVISAGATQFNTYTMTQDIALTDFHFGGRGIGQASLVRIDSTATEQVPSGGFNSSGNVSAWENTGIGDSALTSWSYSTAQAYEGTGSARFDFTKSDINNYVGIRYSWSSAKDLSAWRYVSARAYVTVAAGGVQTRTLSIILTDSNGATRTYSLSGTTTTAPFNTAQFNYVIGEIENPTSESGTFDIYNVVSVRLRLTDGGNKTGTIYWDDVKFSYSMTMIERIYTLENTTFQLKIDPAELVTTGQTIGLIFKNNDATSKEFTATAKGVIAP